MASWQEVFEDLSAEHNRQWSGYRLGGENHAEVRASTEALAAFMQKYEEAGMPDKSIVMPP